jgi:acetylornithine deacetylase/succinyl-diaminopimelate desuccinylase-like protein
MPQSQKPEGPKPAAQTESVASVRHYVATHSASLLRTLLDYVAQPSVSTTGEGVAEAAMSAADLMRAAGLTAEILPTPGSPLVVGSTPGRGDSPRVLIYGHYDVQPPGPLDEWRSPPFRPEVRDGRVYGRGTGDNKGQHLAHLLALRILTETSGGPPCPVTVILDGEEEIGSPHLGWAADRYRDRLEADLVLWSDGPVHDSGRAAVVLGVRGILTFELRARGARYPVHSGNWGGVAPNPAWRLVEVLSSLRDPVGGRVLVDGFYDDVRPFTPEERKVLDDIPADLAAALAELGAATPEPPADRSLYERLVAWPTFTINSLSCEDAGEHRTVIPSVAVARCDIRLVATQRIGRVADLLRAHLARVAPDIEFVPGNAMEPSWTPLGSPYLDAIRSGAAEGLGEEPLLLPALGGSLPLHVFTGQLGLPCYGIPFANVDEANHAPNENLELNRFYSGITASAAILTRLAAESAAGPKARSARSE